MSSEVQSIQEWVQRESSAIDELLQEVRKVIVGQRYMLERMMIGLLADGHLLLEGVPVRIWDRKDERANGDHEKGQES